MLNAVVTSAHNLAVPMMNLKLAEESEKKKGMVCQA